MSRFSRVFASGSSFRFSSVTVAAAMFASLLMLPNSARAQGLIQAPSANLGTGTTPQAVAAADFARTGWIGLVVANTKITDKASTISVFLGNGPNTYASGITYSVCEDPTAVLATDINHDGYPDIIVACTGDATIDVLFNNGAGGFGAATSYYPLSGNPVALVAGDFVGNGYVDIASADSNGNVSVLLNTTGNGTFSASHVTVGTVLSGIAAGDFNKDGHLDLAVSDSTNNKVYTLLNGGTGSFTEFGTGYSTGAGSKPSDIVAADFDQDGNMDVATTNAGTNTAIVLLGNGTGAFTAKTAQPTGTDPIALVTTDVNSDGYPDLVAFDELSGSTGAVAVLLGNGDGTLQVAQTSSQAFLPGTQATVADFNRDGKPDVALTQQGNQTVSVMLNNTLPTQYPDGRSFAAYNPLSIGTGNFADSVAVGDFNKDGNLDVAVSYLQDNDVKVLFGSGNGSFTTGATYAVGSQPYWIASGDFNGDGYPDLVTANTGNNTISVLLNNKNGTFGTAVSKTVGTQPYQVAIGDLNGDGHPDLAVTNYGANTVTILLGSATGTFTVQPTTLATCADPYGVAIGDFKHNGLPSVAVTCYSTSQLEIFPNSNTATGLPTVSFGTPYMYTVGSSINGLTPNPASIALGDFNRDGKLDIVVGDTTANDISFFAGNGDNTFAASVESPSLNFPDSIVAGDFNGDGILDIAGVAANFNAVELTLGEGNGMFGTIAQRAPGELPAKTQPWALAAGDFNNDGQLDIVTANTFHAVNIASPALQTRYLGDYPANPAGNPSVDVLMNASAASISFTTSPSSPIPANTVTTTISAHVQPALSGVTPTGSVIFENSAGSPVGSGPYTLNGSGVASYNPGHLGSGSYLYTTLYSGDANFQPTTISGSNATVTVAGTPVTLALSKSSVNLGSTFVATVTVIGNATTGSYPKGNATIYEVSGNTAISLGTTGTLAAAGNSSTGTVTITANAANNLPVGSYELYAVYNPVGSLYVTGSSGEVPLTVLTVVAEGTATSITCAAGVFGGTCTSTTTVAATGAPVPAGLTVNFSGAGTGTETTNAAGQATFQYSGTIGSYTITASFPAQGIYNASSNSTTVFCFIICGSERTSQATEFNSLSLFERSNQPTPMRLF